ncbi:MAG: GNAT family N-acetyltransferase [Phycisphaerales bacterium]|nr:GNAT family N-acetyltransferase [Phycisphaerales bacterium]
MSDSIIRVYDPNQDRSACVRIMEEVGWGLGDHKETGTLWDSYISDCSVLVAEMQGEAEAWAICRDGDMRYLNQVLPLGFITGVATSRIARGQGLALRTTASIIAEAAERGSPIARLGIFDQGFYDRLGFGSLGYIRLSTIDPSSLRVPRLTRPPHRLTIDDAEVMHACRERRMRWHGACNLTGTGATHSEILWEKTKFGLGFKNQDGQLSHCLLLKPKGEHGPYALDWMAYETSEQFIELLSVLKSLSDQVHGILMADPPHVQMQDMIETPFRTLRSREGGTFDMKPRSNAYEQLRILDLHACINAVTLPGETVQFNLELDDPIADWLPADAAWKGIAGSYRVTLGSSSNVEEGAEPSLPTVTATVGALSRLWIGARSAASLSISDDFRCAPELCDAIDRVMRLPRPITDWDA